MDLVGKPTPVIFDLGFSEGVKHANIKHEEELEKIKREYFYQGYKKGLFADVKKLEETDRIQRNIEIYERSKAGERSAYLGLVYSLTERQIQNIIKKMDESWKNDYKRGQLC